MNLEKRNKLIAKINAQYDEGTGLPVLQLDEFFDGNSDECSLAANQVGEACPTIKEMWGTLREIRDRDDVVDVLLGIHECPEADDEDDFDMWVQAEYVYIYTSASKSDVVEWTRSLGCTEVLDGDVEGVSSAGAPPRAGFKLFALLWD